MQVVGVVGSPRHGMNTGLLVQRVLEGAKSQGVKTELFYLCDYRISPCKACRKCKQTGECVQNDDMKLLDLSIRKGPVARNPKYALGEARQTASAVFSHAGDRVRDPLARSSKENRDPQPHPQGLGLCKRGCLFCLSLGDH